MVSVSVQVQRQEKTDVPIQGQTCRERKIISYSAFYSIQALSRLDEAHPGREE